MLPPIYRRGLGASRTGCSGMPVPLPPRPFTGIGEIFGGTKVKESGTVTPLTVVTITSTNIRRCSVSGGSCLLFIADQPVAVTHHEPPGEFVRFAPRLNHARDYLDRDALLGDLAGVSRDPSQ